MSDTSVIAAWFVEDTPQLSSEKTQVNLAADVALARFVRTIDCRGVSSFALLEGSVIQGWSKPSWRERLAAEIGVYVLRAPGWDGYSAKVIAPDAVKDTITFVRQLSADLSPPLDQPCSDGEVSLVWRQGRRFAEIGFAGDGTFWWYCTDGEREDSGDNVPIAHGIPVELRRIMGFPVEEGTHLVEVGWEEMSSCEPIYNHEVESSYAPSYPTEGQSLRLCTAA